MNTIIIFDLDDTLVNAKMKVPRQTYHMLNKFKKLNYLIGIISYNFMVRIVAKETNLFHYSNHIYYKNMDRDLFFAYCVNQIMNDYYISHVDKIFYVDDRLDNIQVIKEKNMNVITYHCLNMYELYKFKYSI
jgi:FMN phosphatase YigB (HAD superfamily)